MRRATPILVLAAAIAGCGGGDDSTLSKAEYIKQADAICAKFDRELKAIKQPTKAEEIGRYADQATPIARRGVEELRKLEAPDDFKAQADQLIDGLASDTDLFEDLGEAATKKDQARIEQIAEEAEQRTTQRQDQAEAAGFKQCGIES